MRMTPAQRLALRKTASAKEDRIGYWLTDKGGLESFVVPRSPHDYWIAHAGKLYPTLTEAEAAARGSLRVITYGPVLQKEQS